MLALETVVKIRADHFRNKVPIKAIRETKGRTAAETRYFIMGRRTAPEELLKAVRSHWAIENRLHWFWTSRCGRTTCGTGPGTGRRTSRRSAGWL